MLQKILGQDERLYGLLEASAEQARQSILALRQFLDQSGDQRTLEAFIASRRKDKALTNEIQALLCTDLVMALEPHDVEALANSIYKIPKTVEKVAERILLAPQHLRGVDLSGQVTRLERAADILLALVRGLKSRLPRARVAELNAQLQAIEGEADKGMLDLLRCLYNAEHEVGRIVFLKDIHELLERVTDRCRDAGNVLSHIALKGA